MNRNDASDLLSEYVVAVGKTQEAYEIWNKAELSRQGMSRLYREYTNNLTAEGIIYEQIILAMTGGSDESR